MSSFIEEQVIVFLVSGARQVGIKTGSIVMPRRRAFLSAQTTPIS